MENVGLPLKALLPNSNAPKGTCEHSGNTREEWDWEEQHFFRLSLSPEPFSLASAVLGQCWVCGAEPGPCWAWFPSSGQDAQHLAALCQHRTIGLRVWMKVTFPWLVSAARVQARSCWKKRSCPKQQLPPSWVGAFTQSSSWLFSLAASPAWFDLMLHLGLFYFLEPEKDFPALTMPRELPLLARLLMWRGWALRVHSCTGMSDVQRGLQECSWNWGSFELGAGHPSPNLPHLGLSQASRDGFQPPSHPCSWALLSQPSRNHFQLLPLLLPMSSTTLCFVLQGKTLNSASNRSPFSKRFNQRLYC